MSLQLKHVGERVPSQQRRPRFAGALIRIESVRVTLPQAPPCVVSVMVSRPERAAEYNAVCEYVPEEGVMELPSEELSDHEDAPLREIESVALLP